MLGIASRAANAAICWCRLERNGSAPTRSAPTRGCRIVANAVAISFGVLAWSTSEAASSLAPFAFHTRAFRQLRIDQQRDYRSIGKIWPAARWLSSGFRRIDIRLPRFAHPQSRFRPSHDGKPPAGWIGRLVLGRSEIRSPACLATARAPRAATPPPRRRAM